MSDQLKVLISDRTFKVSAGEITLKPFKFMQFALVLGLIEQYLKVFSLYNSATQIVQELLTKVEGAEGTPPQALDFKSSERRDKYTILEDIVKLLTLVSDKESSFFEELQYDEVLSLLTEIIDMNIDFFSRIGRTLNPPVDGKERPKTGE